MYFFAKLGYNILKLACLTKDVCFPFTDKTNLADKEEKGKDDVSNDNSQSSSTPVNMIEFENKKREDVGNGTCSTMRDSKTGTSVAGASATSSLTTHSRRRGWTDNDLNKIEKAIRGYLYDGMGFSEIKFSADEAIFRNEEKEKPDDPSYGAIYRSVLDYCGEMETYSYEQAKEDLNFGPRQVEVFNYFLGQRRNEVSNHAKEGFKSTFLYIYRLNMYPIEAFNNCNFLFIPIAFFCSLFCWWNRVVLEACEVGEADAPA